MERRQLLVCYWISMGYAVIISAYTTTTIEESRAGDVCKGLLRTNEYAPGFVRLAFHDCVGGCNGCIDLLKGANMGLEAYMEPLNEAWNTRRVKEYMSRADFWALCAKEAVLKSFTDAQEESEELRREEAIDRERNARQTNGLTPLEEPGYPDISSPPPQMDMKFGRVDCHPTIANQSTANMFPDSNHGLTDTLKFFTDNFGFNTRETVALLGAHTLGDAKAASSGFEGTFTEHEQWLDNEYYRDLIARAQDWRQVNMRQLAPWQEPRWQWTRPAKNGKLDFVMLNADVCLVKDIKPEATGRVNSTYQQMKLAHTYPIVEEYAGNNALWVQEFAQIFTKMIEKPWPGVTLHHPTN